MDDSYQLLTSCSTSDCMLFTKSLLLLLLAATTCLVQGDLPPDAEAKIGEGVREAVQNGASPAVIVALLDQDNIESMQSDVLQDVNNWYESSILYSEIAAMAGVLLREEGVDALALNQYVVKVDLDEIGTTASPRGSSELQRHLLMNSVPLINAHKHHAKNNKGDKVVVAVIDSGLDADHVNLADDLVVQACFADINPKVAGGDCPDGTDKQVGNGAAEDDNGHGSCMTGIITSKGAKGGVGVAPNSHIVAVKITDGNGKFHVSRLLAALDYILANDKLNVKVINMSLGAGLFSEDCDTVDNSWIKRGASVIAKLHVKGIIAFAAAGNDGSTSSISYLACLKGVVSVGASVGDKNDDKPAAFTNSNEKTDLFAPGMDITSSTLNNGLAMHNGTSAATAHVSGCAALLIESGEATTPAQILARLKKSNVKITRNGKEYPRIDCGPAPDTTTMPEGGTSSSTRIDTTMSMSMQTGTPGTKATMPRLTTTRTPLLTTTTTAAQTTMTAAQTTATDMTANIPGTTTTVAIPTTTTTNSISTTTSITATTMDEGGTGTPCDPTFCQSCFYYCGVPPYDCDANAGPYTCEIDPLCKVCEAVCLLDSEGKCPGGACPSDPDFECHVVETCRL